MTKAISCISCKKIAKCEALAKKRKMRKKEKRKEQLFQKLLQRKILQ